MTDKLLDYGCWCRLLNEEAGGIVAGHGTPVDALDEACKAWHQCKSCTSKDFESCDPNNALQYDVQLDQSGQRLVCPRITFDCNVSIFVAVVRAFLIL